MWMYLRIERTHVIRRFYHSRQQLLNAYAQIIFFFDCFSLFSVAPLFAISSESPFSIFICYIRFCILSVSSIPSRFITISHSKDYATQYLFPWKYTIHSFRTQHLLECVCCCCSHVCTNYIVHRYILYLGCWFR